MDRAISAQQGDDDEASEHEPDDPRQPGTGGSLSTPVEEVRQDAEGAADGTIPPDGNGTAISPSR